MNAAILYREWLHDAHQHIQWARNARMDGDRQAAIMHLTVAGYCRKSAMRVLRRMKINRGVMTVH